MRAPHHAATSRFAALLATTSALVFACSTPSPGTAENAPLNFGGNDIGAQFGADGGGDAVADTAATGDTASDDASTGADTSTPTDTLKSQDSGPKADTTDDATTADQATDDSGGAAEAGHLCAPCDASSFCQGDGGKPGSVCVNRSELGSFCGLACTADKDCPEDYDCQTVDTVEDTTAKQCMPTDNKGTPVDCTCSQKAIEAKLATTCAITAKDTAGKPIGTCKGTRVCTQLGLTKCDAKPPAAETCDLLDNDCDGETDNSTCDDSDLCTSDVCGQNGCVHTPTTGGPCDDGDTCTLGEFCATGKCQGGTQVCACKTDGDCQTGNLCNGVAYCDQSGTTPECKLKAGSAVTCSTANDTGCAKSVCDGASGKCFMTAVAAGAGCDDGDACTTDDVCQGGLCKAGKSVCECKSDADCKAKDDADLCNGSLICNTGQHVCQLDASSIVTCAAATNNCVKNACNATSGKCAEQQLTKGTSCNDGDPCTVDDACDSGSCEGGKTVCECQKDADCAGKDGGNKCVGTFACVANACKLKPGSAVDCDVSKDTDCQKNACVPATGVCALSNVPDGGFCKPDGPCQPAGKCATGKCTGATGTPCDDDNPCTTDACENATGQCKNDAVTDGTKCGAGVCKGGDCEGESKLTVDAPADADTWLETDNGNYGTNKHLIVATSGSYAKKRSLMRFDMSKIPKAAKVSKATLWLFIDYWHDALKGNDVAVDRPVQVHEVLRVWSESKATAKSSGVQGLHLYWKAKWLAFDDFDAAKQATATATWQANGTGWKEFDITPLAQKWVDDASKNFGVLVWATNEDKTGREPRWFSKDATGNGAGRHPYVKVDYLGK